MGRFPGQFLRRTELIKRSLRLDDEPKWWCREPLHPGLAAAAKALGLPGTASVPTLSFVRIAARFECGSVREQLLHAVSSYFGRPWFDALLYKVGDSAVGGFCVGEARAIVRMPDGDVVLVREMEPVDSRPGCPLAARGCLRLRWAFEKEDTDASLRCVKLADVQRAVHVVPDFADLAARRGLQAVPSRLSAPVKEHREMLFFLNIFFPF